MSSCSAIFAWNGKEYSLKDGVQSDIILDNNFSTPIFLLIVPEIIVKIGFVHFSVYFCFFK